MSNALGTDWYPHCHQLEPFSYCVIAIGGNTLDLKRGHKAGLPFVPPQQRAKMAAKRMSKRQAREEEELAALQKQAGRLSTPGEDKIEEADGEAGNVKYASPRSNCKTVQAQPVSAFAAVSFGS